MPKLKKSNTSEPGKATNFRVARSLFGDYWVGLTDEPIDDKKVFGTQKQAQERAVWYTMNRDDTSNDEIEYQIERIREPDPDEPLSVVPSTARF